MTLFIGVIVHVLNNDKGYCKIAITLFLGDPSPIIVYPCHSLTDSLTHSCSVNLIDVTLACEDANSKLVEVVTVADVDSRHGICQKFYTPRFSG